MNTTWEANLQTISRHFLFQTNLNINVNKQITSNNIRIYSNICSHYFIPYIYTMQKKTLKQSYNNTSLKKSSPPPPPASSGRDQGAHGLATSSAPGHRCRCSQGLPLRLATRQRLSFCRHQWLLTFARVYNFIIFCTDYVIYNSVVILVWW